MDNRGTASQTTSLVYIFYFIHSLFVVVVVIYYYFKTVIVCSSMNKSAWQSLWLVVVKSLSCISEDRTPVSHLLNHLKFHIWSHILSNHRQFYQIQIINRVQLKSPSFTIFTRQTEMQCSTRKLYSLVTITLHSE